MHCSFVLFTTAPFLDNTQIETGSFSANAIIVTIKLVDF